MLLLDTKSTPAKNSPYVMDTRERIFITFIVRNYDLDKGIRQRFSKKKTSFQFRIH